MIDPVTGQEEKKVEPTIAPALPIAGLINANLLPAATTTGAVTPAPTATSTPSTAALTQWNVSPDQTVEERIKGIINTNNPLQQLAETYANQQSNQRGLLNSSMAVGSAQDAMVKNAFPIAQQDATTFADAAKTNAAASNQNSQYNATNTQQNDQFNVSETNKITAKALDQENQIKLMEIESQYKETTDANQSAAGLYDTFQKAISTIDSHEPPYAPGRRTELIDQARVIMENGLSMYQDIEGLNLSGILGDVTSSTDGSGGTTSAGGSISTGGSLQNDLANTDAGSNSWINTISPTDRYLEENPDVANPNNWGGGKTAADHWNMTGKAEGRKWYGALDASGRAVTTETTQTTEPASNTATVKSGRSGFGGGSL